MVSKHSEGDGTVITLVTCCDALQHRHQGEDEQDVPPPLVHLDMGGAPGHQGRGVAAGGGAAGLQQRGANIRRRGHCHHAAGGRGTGTIFFVTGIQLWLVVGY